MGIYWAATGLGNKLAAAIGGFAEKAGKANLPGDLIFCTLTALLVILLLKQLKNSHMVLKNSKNYNCFVTLR